MPALCIDSEKIDLTFRASFPLDRALAGLALLDATQAMAALLRGSLR